MRLKVDIVNEAYRQMRISGLTINPKPEFIETALSVLEGMMALLEEGRNLCVGYKFEEVPDANTEHGVRNSHFLMMATNLAIQLIPHFNKTVPQILYNLAGANYTTSSAIVAAANIRQVQAPRTMPRGSGNTNKYNRWQLFNRNEILAPNDCETNKIIVGEINDYAELFLAYLKTEIIASFTIEVSAGLLLLISSNTDDTVSYRVQGVTNTTSFQSVLIKITTDTGRVEHREVAFELTS